MRTTDTTTTTRPEFTTSAFVRSRGTQPRGRGSWAFQATRSTSAFDRDLTGPVWFSPGNTTLTEARKLAAVAPELAGAECLAVLP